MQLIQVQNKNEHKKKMRDDDDKGVGGCDVLPSFGGWFWGATCEQSPSGILYWRGPEYNVTEFYLDAV